MNIKQFRYGNSTAIKGGIDMAIKQFNLHDAINDHLLIITDGRDEDQPSLEKTRVRLSGMGIHSVAIGFNHPGRKISVRIYFD